jgi:hypothetical protein
MILADAEVNAIRLRGLALGPPVRSIASQILSVAIGDPILEERNSRRRASAVSEVIVGRV